MLSNACIKTPVNDLLSNGFLNSRSYGNNKRTFQIKDEGHKAVYFNYAGDLLSIVKFADLLKPFIYILLFFIFFSY